MMYNVNKMPGIYGFVVVIDSFNIELIYICNTMNIPLKHF